MSARELPVVACVIDVDGAGRTHVDDPQWASHEAIPSVALPWALLEDADLAAAVARRAIRADSDMDPSVGGVLRALAAELRARAGHHDNTNGGRA